MTEFKKWFLSLVFVLFLVCLFCVVTYLVTHFKIAAIIFLSMAGFGIFSFMVIVVKNDIFY